MDMTMIFEIFFNAACVFVGVMIGCTIRDIKRSKPDGYFRVNTTDPDKDVFTLELTCPLGEIPTKKRLIFEVTNVGSQEKPLA